MKEKSATAISAKARKDSVVNMNGSSNAFNTLDEKYKRFAYKSETFYQSIRSTTRFRIAWLHYKHPEWKVQDIIADMLKWYAKDLPKSVVADMKQFIKEEWKQKSYEGINAASFDLLFNK